PWSASRTGSPGSAGRSRPPSPSPGCAARSRSSPGSTPRERSSRRTRTATPPSRSPCGSAARSTSSKSSSARSRPSPPSATTLRLVPDALAIVANTAGKLTREGLRVMGRGATALPGLVALTLDPDFISALSRELPHGVVCVSGTNGKTTTSRMLSDIARATGWAPIHNRSGSNLDRGVAAALLADATWSGEPRGPRCRSPLRYERVVLAHVGVWSCPTGDFTRPARDVSATKVVLGPRGSEVVIGGVLASMYDEIRVPVPGLYNVYNALAALAAARALAIGLPESIRALANFTPAFGRLETVEVNGKTLRLVLVKNPAGFNAA